MGRLIRKRTLMLKNVENQNIKIYIEHWVFKIKLFPIGSEVQMFNFQIQDFVTLRKARQSFFKKTLEGSSPNSNYN
jgi:hypothetical protein